MKFVKVILILTVCFSSSLLMAQSDALIHQYKFDGTLEDAVGDSNGVYVAGDGNLAFIEGHDGTANGAIDFPVSAGGGYMIQVGRFSPQKEGVDGEMTITFWGLWHGNTGSWQDIINKRDGWSAEKMTWGINQHSATGDVISLRRSGLNADSKQGMPEGVWTHVAVAFNNTSGDVWFYMDGVQYDNLFYESGTKYDAKIVMGSSANDPEPLGWRPGDAYNGALDDVRFYSRVLTEAEILAVFNGTDTAVDDKLTTAPAQFELAQNFPNPFNPSTRISYNLTKNTKVELNVYDIYGQNVVTLVHQYQGAGTYNVVWDASKVSAGVYVYTMKTGDAVVSKKMMLVK